MVVSVYLKGTAFPHSEGIPQEVKVGPGDLYILNTADVGAGHHLTPFHTQTEHSKSGSL